MKKLDEVYELFKLNITKLKLDLIITESSLNYF